MVNRIISGLFCICIGLLLIAIPHCLFPVCSAELQLAGKDLTVPMKCFWTARAELGAGLVIIASGIMLFLFKNPHTRIGISVATTAVAVLAFAVPTWLIGVCLSETMLCRIGTLPALQLSSGILFLFTLLNALYLYRTNKTNKLR